MHHMLQLINVFQAVGLTIKVSNIKAIFSFNRQTDTEEKYVILDDQFEITLL